MGSCHPGRGFPTPSQGRVLGAVHAEEQCMIWSIPSIPTVTFSLKLRQNLATNRKQASNPEWFQNLNWCRSYWKDLTHRVVEMPPWKPVFHYIGYWGGFLPVIVLLLEGYHRNLFLPKSTSLNISISSVDLFILAFGSSFSFFNAVKVPRLKRPGKGDAIKSL